MAIRFTFFPTPQHKVFHYEPRYYDPRKERLEQLYEKYGKTPEGMKKAEEELAAEQTAAGADPAAQPASSKDYVPGSRIRGAFTRSVEESRRAEGNQKVKKILTLITILAAIVVAYYLSQGLVKLL